VFEQVNTCLTIALCNAIRHEISSAGRKVPLLFTSSIQAELENPYGLSKLAAERVVASLAKDTGNPCVVFRLQAVFGKWCKPNYNSVVATFCHNIARGLPIHISDPTTDLQLVYVDDVVSALIGALESLQPGVAMKTVQPEYAITLGELANKIKAFDACRDSSLKIERVGGGLLRALYATYVSYLPNERFIYEVPKYGDYRGVFVEMLKTHDSGQLSYFTAHPGITRGGHYHHSKTEKFLVVKGVACFKFRHMHTKEEYELVVNGEVPTIVESIPGWAHDVTNVGVEEMIVMLWANEIFDCSHPDTYACPL
jgi:UDP-2-acetamido-2,6-beta-L-arabino-hexul-4-ose reductase